MIRTIHKSKLEYGDFQTPLELTEKVCQKLIELGVNPDFIVEPTCGIGNFIEIAIHKFPSTKKIIGLEFNSVHLQELKKKSFVQNEIIDIIQGDFFTFDWPSLIDSLDGKILVLGNFPWVTNSQQGRIDSTNLPKKNNFLKHSGLNAITGKSNFDISEWMLIQVVHWLQKGEAYLAMLCKTSVSRKLLNYLHSQKLNLSYCASYKIDTKKYFAANVEACLLFCKFNSNEQKYFCDVFNSLDSSFNYRIGYSSNLLVKDVLSFEKLNKLYDKSSATKWRSGIKHDCSSIMEFHKVGDSLINGLGEIIDIEDTYLFPLLKSSDIAQNRTEFTKKYVLVTQKSVGEATAYIKDFAPKTWNYLESHASYLDNRKSKIYQNNPRFSIFGVGSYTFAPWKIAISGLYKQLEFRLIANINNKPVVFDDTVYFLSFDEARVAYKIFEILNSQLANQFYSSLIFWDEKRPIKSSILNSLNLKKLAAELIDLT